MSKESFLKELEELKQKHNIEVKAEIEEDWVQGYDPEEWILQGRRAVVKYVEKGE